MKIALITLHTPTATNVRGASALPYHIAKYRDIDIDMEIWSFNSNRCGKEQITQSETELKAKIHIIHSSQKTKLLAPTLVRFFLPYPFQYYISLPKNTVEEINGFLSGENTNGVWIYGEDIAHIIKQFINYKCVITTPDCEAMYYYRLLAEQGVPTSWKLLFRYGLMFHRYAKMASEFPISKNIKYHLVGMEDVKFLKKLNPNIDAHFIRHPHYDICPHSININKHDKIRLLIAGRYDISMSKAIDEAVAAILPIAERIKDKYSITFLGKSWDKSSKQLMDAGFNVEKKEYVENYAAEVSSYDIQLAPITVGTGTKGKVLDAFANGLMVIGTQRALENILVKNGNCCIQYEDPKELAYWLLILAESTDKIAEIANNGRNAVLKYHNREYIAKEFFKLFD